MTLKEIENQVINYKSSGKKMFVTSSFQTHSIPLLHILSRIIANIDVMFINTGFHFPETISFRDEVAELLGLNLIDVTSPVPKSQQKDSEGQLFFVSDPDYCCYLNKVKPLEPYLIQYDVWINGVRRNQSSFRKTMQTEQSAPFNTIRFHPILDWSSEQIQNYCTLHQLPEHPLDKFGYKSIGCAPCTMKSSLLDERSARWFGMNKTECGLHKDLIE